MSGSKGHQSVARHTAQDVANFFLALNELDERDFYSHPMNKHKLHFLLIQAQGWYLSYTGKPLFTGDIVAGRRGPEVAGMYEDLRRIKSEIFLEKHFYEDDFTKKERLFIRRIWDIYGISTGTMIGETNSHKRWKKLRGEPWRPAPVISHELLWSYFDPENQPWTLYEAFEPKDADAIWLKKAKKKR